MAHRNPNPESCRLHCSNMQKWQENPEDFTELQDGKHINAEIMKKAERICPGVSMFLKIQDASEVVKNENETLTVPSYAIHFQCEFYQALYGPDMGS